MGITDPGVPSTDAWSVLKDLIENNMESPDGSWTPSVNNGWLEHKKQKTYQIVISPIIGVADQIQLDGTSSTAAARTDMFFIVTLFAPSRDERWQLWQKFKKLLNNKSLCAPMGPSGPTGVGGSDWHFVILERSEQSVDIRFLDDVCGPGKPDTGTCNGYRAEASVLMRCNE